jgi:hypothetical protein
LNAVRFQLPPLPAHPRDQLYPNPLERMDRIHLCRLRPRPCALRECRPYVAISGSATGGCFVRPALLRIAASAPGGYTALSMAFKCLIRITASRLASAAAESARDAAEAHMVMRMKQMILVIDSKVVLARIPASRGKAFSQQT